MVSSRITIPFGKLFASGGYVSYPLLTLTPLYLGYPFLARLACLSPAASVRSEPGSNSSKVFVLALHHYFIPKFKRIDLKRLVVTYSEEYMTVCFVSLYSYCVVNPLDFGDLRHLFQPVQLGWGEDFVGRSLFVKHQFFVRFRVRLTGFPFTFLPAFQPACLRWGGHHGDVNDLSISCLQTVKIYQRIGVFPGESGISRTSRGTRYPGRRAANPRINSPARSSLT